LFFFLFFSLYCCYRACLFSFYTIFIVSDSTNGMKRSHDAMTADDHVGLVFLDAMGDDYDYDDDDDRGRGGGTVMPSMYLWTGTRSALDAALNHLREPVAFEPDAFLAIVLDGPPWDDDDFADVPSAAMHAARAAIVARLGPDAFDEITSLSDAPVPIIKTI
jgi:hypothetical protein